jgi:glycosyltransferase involved in cell wall biosynthesis
MVEITCLLPTLNSEKYLTKAINSLVKQTFNDIEVLILDGGSEDNTLGIVENFKDSRLRVIKVPNNNKDLAGSLNYGIAISKGKYIARMDSDDIAHTKRFEIQRNFLLENQAIDIVCSVGYKIDINDKVISTVGISGCNELLRWLMIFENPIIHPSVMFRSDICKYYINNENMFYERNKEAEDYILWCKLTEKHKIYCLNEKLIYLRERFDSKSEQKKLIINNEKILIKKELLNYYLKDIKKSNDLAIILNGNFKNKIELNSNISKSLSKIWLKIYSDTENNWKTQLFYSRILIYTYLNFKIKKYLNAFLFLIISIIITPKNTFNNFYLNLFSKIFNLPILFKTIKMLRKSIVNSLHKITDKY